ncbi:MAG: vacuolar iron transporter family protein [Chloroflexota bacterium]|jgi:VIT1/CCC1 family predicted Fe2+/Mn2+ transporter|nr:vacuolar iron transporter family protein [Chloroflexota bacterium]
MTAAEPAREGTETGDQIPRPASLEATAHIGATRARIAARSRVREVIFGTQDGLLTTLGLVTAVGGATTDRYTVLVAGLAGALAGMIAMGAGAYISSKSQLDVAQAEVEREMRELEMNPERELEELVQLFESEGLPERDARLVAEKIAQRPEAMLVAMTQKEMGLALDSSEPRKEGAVMALAFLVGAVVPLTPWFLASTRHVGLTLGLELSPALLFSVTGTVIALFAMGVGKARLAHSNRLRGGLEVMAIGIVAAAASYLLGSVLPLVAGPAG